MSTALLGVTDTASRSPAVRRAVRSVDRWALVAGVTGFLSNALLLALFTTPVDGPYAWTGPANDVVGDLSTLTMVPLALALLVVCGGGTSLRVATAFAVVAMVAMVGVSVSFVLGHASFTAATNSAYLGLMLMFGWLFTASRTGRARARLPRTLAICGELCGAVGTAGAALLTLSALAPDHSTTRAIAFDLGVVTAAPTAVYPAWLIWLSYRLPPHLS